VLWAFVWLFDPTTYLVHAILRQTYLRDSLAPDVEVTQRTATPRLWYLASGTSRQGNILEVRFPLSEDGGPISEPAALRLLDPDRPFLMSFGQWLFVHAEWLSQRIESLPSEDTSESLRSFEVTTIFPGPSPSSSSVDKVQTVVDASPPPPVPRGGPSDQDYERQRRRLISLEATVGTLMDELRSSHNEVQAAIASCEEQEITISGLMHCLDTTE
jgi:hypothetical protein